MVIYAHMKGNAETGFTRRNLIGAELKKYPVDE